MMYDICSLSQLKSVLEKRLRYSIYKIEYHVSDFYHIFNVGNNTDEGYYWNFSDVELTSTNFVNTIENPLFYGKIAIKIRSSESGVFTSLYQFYMSNYVVKSVNQLLQDYDYQASVIPFHYYFSTAPVVDHQLLGFPQQVNITPENGANLIFSDHLKIRTLTDASGSFGVELIVFFEGVKIYFR